MTFAMKGLTGTLRAGGRPALAFERFEFTTRDPSMGGGWRLEARVTTKDDYWLDRDVPMELRLDPTRSHDVPEGHFPADTRVVAGGPVTLEIPVLSSWDPLAFALTGVALLLLLWRGWTPLRTLGLCAAVGLVVGLVG